jgi:hypothetical protein
LEIADDFASYSVFEFRFSFYVLVANAPLCITLPEMVFWQSASCCLQAKLT